MSRPKPSDVQFFGRDRPVVLRGCDHPACAEAGTYKAPKSREAIDQYYWFCLDHVRIYNEEWDYFQGMKPAEIEAQIKFATTWERETQPLGGLKTMVKSAAAWARAEETIREKARNAFFAEEADEFAPMEPEGMLYFPPPARAALAVLGLELRKGESMTFAVVKARYKTLVKLHHPDANNGSLEAEEKFKTINQAFASLKAFFSEMVAA
jgi:hypothetical protein